MVEKRKLLYVGKAKKMYETTNTDVVWVEYLNQATALNGAKKDTILGKAALNNQITSEIFSYLSSEGIENHFIEKLSKTEQLVKQVEIIPLEVVLRNVAAGSFSKRLAIEEGVPLPFPVIEFYYKEDALDDPMINEDHIKFLKIATKDQVDEIKAITLQVDQSLTALFAKIDLWLIDFKLEFGLSAEGKVLLADEISPDTCRLWDMDTNEHMDKDIYRRDLGDLVPVYQEVFDRLSKMGK